MRYIFINHGFMGSNIENWFPYIKESLDDNNNQVIIPQYPIDGDKHFYDYWKKVLDVYKEFQSNTIEKRSKAFLAMFIVLLCLIFTSILLILYNDKM